MGIIENKQYPPEYIRRIKQFKLIDDTFFNSCMDGNIEAMQLILRIIMNIMDLCVIDVVAQRSLENLYGRNAKLDVLAKDSTGKLYNIEVQRANQGAHPKRARYNSALIDVREVDKGVDVENLPEKYVIFITENDYFKEGLPLYSYSMRRNDNYTLLNDGSNIIYVNGQYRGNNPLGKLMQDFSCIDPKLMHYEELAKITSYYKEAPKGVANMCEIMEEFGLERENEGIQKGIQQGVEYVAKQLLSDGTPIEYVIKITNLTPEKVMSLKQQI